MEITPGAILKMKKKHPCGNFEWEVLYAGSDLKLKCMGCGHVIMIARSKIIRDVKDVRRKESEA